MAKIDKIENGTEYNKFSTNELYLRQAAILDADDSSKIELTEEQKNTLQELNGIITIKQGTQQTQDTQGTQQTQDTQGTQQTQDTQGDPGNYYITLSDLVELNEILEKERFGNLNQYSQEVEDLIQEKIDYVLDETKSDKNTKYGQDSLTEAQKARAKEFLGEDANNAKNMYLSTAQMLVDAGYWGSTTMNERLQDIMNGDRLIGESYGVMMDALNRYNIADEKHNITTDWYDSEKGVTAYEPTKAELLEENQDWSLNTSTIITAIERMLEGNTDTITLKNLSDKEIQLQINELFQDDQLKNLPTNILNDLKTCLDKVQNGELTMDSQQVKEILNKIYNYNSLQEALSNQKDNTELAESAKKYFWMLVNGEKTVTEILDELFDSDYALFSELSWILLGKEKPENTDEQATNE